VQQAHSTLGAPIDTLYTLGTRLCLISDAQQEAGSLFLPQKLNRLHEAYFVRGEDASNVAAIPAQNRLNTLLFCLLPQAEAFVTSTLYSRRTFRHTLL
jgi:hypothetical protein